MKSKIRFRIFVVAIVLCPWVSPVYGQTEIAILTAEKHQVIDGFGAFQGGDMVNQQWWQELFFDDIRASIYRVDLTPQLVSPYSDLNVYSPWFMGSSVNSVFNLEDPDNPNGPENNRVRTYSGPGDYSREFGGENAPIAVMGPDIEQNIAYFRYSTNNAITIGESKKDSLGDFKLIGSIWSPVPWVKETSGNTYDQDWWPGPVAGSAWPFIWGGNYAGGTLDVSGEPLAVFDDTALGGSGPTSSLTQFARSTAAYVKGYQDFHGVKFYAISIQNELNFEEFYNSATYPLSTQYIAALKAVRTEFDKYTSLRDIRIMGPEDLLGGTYALWQYGGNDDPTHKNLQYLQNIGNDPDASAAIDFFCIHGYDNDGVSAGMANPTFWENWKNGWTESPAPGIPPNVNGYAYYGKKSWMTETSGEVSQWLSPVSGFPGYGGWSIAQRIHQALTAGDQSAWIYWTFVDTDDGGDVTNFGLTSQLLGNNAPKYAAAKHFFNPIRPNSVRVTTTTSENSSFLASAYLHEENSTLVVVILNSSSTAGEFSLNLPEFSDKDFTATSFTSYKDNYWLQGQIAITQGSGENITLPAYSVISIVIDLEDNTTGVDHPVEINSNFSLEVYPNPVHEKGYIEFVIPEKSLVNLTLYDFGGKIISEILKEEALQGPQKVLYPTDKLSSGTYILNLCVKGNSEIKKWVIEK